MVNIVKKKVEEIIELKEISKNYGKIRVLNNISMILNKGEIHGLLGTNGSGKSTLLNILFGNPIIEESGGYTGKLILRGEEINPFSHKTKEEFGMIHQEFILISGMSIWENINIGKEITSKNTQKYLGKELAHILPKKNKEEVREILKKLNIEIDIDTNVENISTNIKQFVEIAREIKKKELKILFLDEPTASLNKNDSEILMKILKKLAKEGLTIVFISHRLDEIVVLCDRITIIRDGELISKYNKQEFDIKTIEKDMIGMTVEQSKTNGREIKGNIILKLENFGVSMPGDKSKDINLDIIEGEILGITSLSGHGKSSIGYGLGGLLPVNKNTEVKYFDKSLNLLKTVENINKGIVVLTEDRKNTNLLMQQSIEENLAFTNIIARKKYLRNGILGKLGFIDNFKIKEETLKAIKNYDIKTSSTKQTLKELSGGNQQKVCIARAISLEPKLLFVGEPTRGIDVGAKEKVLKTLLKINREKNTTVVISSCEIEELERICDRVVVLSKGKVLKIITSKEVNYE